MKKNSYRYYQKQEHRFLKALLMLGIVAIIAFVGWYVQRAIKNTDAVLSSGQTSSTGGAAKAQAGGDFITYETKTGAHHFIVTDTAGKIVSNVAMPSGKNTFSIVARGPGNVILQASNKSTYNPVDDAKSVFMSVGFDGTVTNLPASVADQLRAVQYKMIAVPDKQAALFVMCDSANCRLRRLNLGSGQVDTLLTKPYTPATPDKTDASMYLLAASRTTAYLLEDSQTDAGEIHKLSLVSQQDSEESVPLEIDSLNPPVVSSDFKRAIYSSQRNEGNVYIVNLSTGDITPITTGLGYDNEDFVWSPDGKEVAFTISGTADRVNASQLALIDLQSKSAHSVKSFGTTKFNAVTLGGWKTDTSLYYSYATTKVANTFANHGEDDYVDISTGQATQNLAPAGYKLIGLIPKTKFLTK